MNSVSKPLTLTFVVLLLSSLFVLIITPANVQATSKPSVPQFTVKLVDNSYDVPSSTTTTTNPYTGEKTTTTKPGYHVENIQIEVTIKNQAYPDLMYNIRTKGHFEEQWAEHYGVGRAMFPAQSDGKYTIIKLDTMENAYTKIYPEGAQIDFQVAAVHGTINRELFANGYVDDVFRGVTSDWSKTQTIIITYGASSSMPSQTAVLPENPSVLPYFNQTSPESQLPSFVFHPTVLLWIGTFLFVGVVIVVVMVFLRRCLKTSSFNSSVYNLSMGM